MIIPQLLIASIVSLGNILCSDFSQEEKFQLPSREIPERTTPGGSRNDGQCFLNPEQTILTPLVPSNNFGLTLAQYPTIFVHIPTTSAQQAFFSLQNRDGNLHYQTTIPLPERSGVISITLPEAAQSLMVDTDYKWSLVLICGQQLEPDDPQVSGWIKRVKLDSTLAQLPELDVSHESVCLLSQQGIWYDLLHQIAQLRKAQPENHSLAGYWEELLIKMGLEKIANQPLFY